MNQILGTLVANLMKSTRNIDALHIKVAVYFKDRGNGADVLGNLKIRNHASINAEEMEQFVCCKCQTILKSVILVYKQCRKRSTLNINIIR